MSGNRVWALFYNYCEGEEVFGLQIEEYRFIHIVSVQIHGLQMQLHWLLSLPCFTWFIMLQQTFSMRMYVVCT